MDDQRLSEVISVCLREDLEVEQRLEKERKWMEEKIKNKKDEEHVAAIAFAIHSAIYMILKTHPELLFHGKPPKAFRKIASEEINRLPPETKICFICRKTFSGLIWHHISYYPEHMIPVCSGCNLKIHRSNDYPVFKPKDAQAAMRYRHDHNALYKYLIGEYKSYPTINYPICATCGRKIFFGSNDLVSHSSGEAIVVCSACKNKIYNTDPTKTVFLYPDEKKSIVKYRGFDGKPVYGHLWSFDIK